MDYQRVAGFVAELRLRASTAALALEFLILTAARLGEVRGARWSEIDLEARTWTLPPERMKGGRLHRVPLSNRAVTILEELAATSESEFVFLGAFSGKLLSASAMQGLLRGMKPTCTVHGFRSSFRDWAGNETPFPRDLIETALAHIVGDETEQAYRRSDALEKRRQLMEAWATYCEPGSHRSVISMRLSHGS
jgi:integrase